MLKSLLLTLIGTLLFSQVTYAHPKTEKPATLCDQLLKGPVQLTKEDLELFKKSKTEPVLSGGVLPDADFLRYNEDKKGQLVNQWHVYFIRIGQQECYDSPTRTMIGLKERLNAIAARRMAMNDVHHPLRLFFVCGEVQIAKPSQVSSEFDKETVYDQKSKRGENAFFDIAYGLTVRDTRSFRRYKFGQESAIILLGDGNQFDSSGWNDDFITGHEIGHATEFSFLGVPKYFSEGQSDFKAYLISGQAQTAHRIGAERNPTDPQYKTIDDFFTNFSRTADNYQVGAMFAHFLYLVHEKQKALKIKYFMASLLHRTMELLSESPLHVKSEGEYTTFQLQDKYNKDDVMKVFNFIASVTVQASIENKMPPEMTRWMCYNWTEYFGVKGPFKRYQGTYDSDDEKKLKIPKTWKDCDDLMVKISR